LHVKLNGKSATVIESATLGALVDMFVADRRGVAVAVNGQVVTRSQWDSQTLNNDDSIEVLSIAAGG
jgi:sulfur carrier protein